MDLLAVIKNPLIAMGRYTMVIVQELGRIVLFFLKGFILIFSQPLQINKILQQVYFIGMKSVFVVCLTGAFTGMVLGLQGYYLLVKYGSTGILGSAVALSLGREMGPVLAAVMVIASRTKRIGRFGGPWWRFVGKPCGGHFCVAKI